MGVAVNPSQKVRYPKAECFIYILQVYGIPGEFLAFLQHSKAIRRAFFLVLTMRRRSSRLLMETLNLRVRLIETPFVIRLV